MPLTITNASGVFTGTIPTQAEIPVAGSVVVSIATQEVVGTPSDSIELTAPGAGATYVVGNVSPEFPLFINNSVASTTQPAMSIAADTNETVNVNSASEVSFTLTASHEPNDKTTAVSVVVSETGTGAGSFIASTFEKTQTVTLAASGVTTPFSVAIADSDDTDDAADSVITVTLVDEGISTPLYILADAPGQMATATVTDDALPALGELSIGVIS